MQVIDQNAPKIFYRDRRLSMQSEDMAAYFGKEHFEIIEIIESLPLSEEFFDDNIFKVRGYKHYSYTIFAEGFAMLAIYLLDKYCADGDLSKDDEDYEFSMDFLIEKLKGHLAYKQENLKQAA